MFDYKDEHEIFKDLRRLEAQGWAFQVTLPQAEHETPKEILPRIENKSHKYFLPKEDKLDLYSQLNEIPSISDDDFGFTDTRTAEAVRDDFLKGLILGGEIGGGLGDNWRFGFNDPALRKEPLEKLPKKTKTEKIIDRYENYFYKINESPISRQLRLEAEARAQDESARFRREARDLTIGLRVTGEETARLDTSGLVSHGRTTPADLIRESRLNAFAYSIAMDEKVEQEGLKVVQNPVFVEMEAAKLTSFYSPLMSKYLNRTGRQAAESRYDATVAPVLSQAIAGGIFARGLGYIAATEKAGRLDSIEAVRDQVNKVNFCQAQVREILSRRKVKDAYVDKVSERIEQLADRL